jgi:hypothetical protein
VRLWSLHPRHLDCRGLLALWREALLAREVLRGRTKGYRAHPQLARFRAHPRPLAAIEAYLLAVLAEAERRAYDFDAAEVRDPGPVEPIQVCEGQIGYEARHLLAKLRGRDPAACRALRACGGIEPHPLFVVVKGGIEPWEKVPRGRGAKARSARATPQRAPSPGGRVSSRARRDLSLLPSGQHAHPSIRTKSG